MSVPPMQMPSSPAVVAVAPLSPGAADTRRRSPDRRRRPTPMLSRWTLAGGRRKAVRRAAEREGAFLDAYGWKVGAMALAVLLFNALDAVFTLFLIGEGAAVELNPVADLLMVVHPQVFIWVKTLGIGGLLLFLVVAQNFRPARIGLRFLFGLYGLLVLYHLTLLVVYMGRQV